MAATAALTERIQRQLEGIHAFTDDLSIVEAEWDSLDDEGQAVTALRWDHYMADYLFELDEHYRAKEMLPAQEEQYCSLLRKLRDAMPILERLEFMLPPVSLAPADEVA